MELLTGLRVVEGSAFVAAPLGGLTLAQLGADVIRFDTIGGGLDYRRWPVTDEGVSLYWAGLNKGKRSIAIDLSKPEGRELATALITAPGDDAGVFLSNFPESGWLSDARLRARRADLVYLNIVGNPDESTAVDYTVNAASGIASADRTRRFAVPREQRAPRLGHRHRPQRGDRDPRRRTPPAHHREGQLIKLSLADVAFTMVANLGFLAQAQVTHENRPPLGNDMYGAFGRDFATQRRPARHGRRHQPQPVAHARARRPGIEEYLAPMERAFNADFRKEEDRYRARDAIAALLKPWFEAAIARRGAQGARRARRVLGSVPDLHAVARRRLAGVAREPGVRRRRPPRDRLAAHARVAAAVPHRSARRPRAGAAARHAHRRGARVACSGSPPPRSAACTTTAWSPRAGARRARERRARAQPTRAATDAAVRLEDGSTPTFPIGRAGGPVGRVHRRRSRGARRRARSPRCGTGRASSPTRPPPRSGSTAIRAGARRWPSSRNACGSADACGSRDPLRIGAVARRASRDPAHRRQGRHRPDASGC